MKSKCPCCGNDLEYRHELKAYVCDECQFRCPSLFLPRMAATFERCADDVKNAKAELAALKAAILGSHPTGEVEGAEPLVVLHSLFTEWMGELMRGPAQEIEFMDGDALRKIVFEAGDASVGINDCYCVIDPDKPNYSELEEELAALKAAVIEARDSITCLCAEGPEFMKASEIRETIVKDITKLARLCGEE
jgi:hypothetical protein